VRAGNCGPPVLGRRERRALWQSAAGGALCAALCSAHKHKQRSRSTASEALLKVHTMHSDAESGAQVGQVRASGARAVPLHCRPEISQQGTGLAPDASSASAGLQFGLQFGAPKGKGPPTNGTKLAPASSSFPAPLRAGLEGRATWRYLMGGRPGGRGASGGAAPATAPHWRRSQLLLDEPPQLTATATGAHQVQ